MALLNKRPKKPENDGTSLKLSLKFGNDKDGGEKIVLNWEGREQPQKQRPKQEPKSKATSEDQTKTKKPEASPQSNPAENYQGTSSSSNGLASFQQAQSNKATTPKKVERKMEEESEMSCSKPKPSTSSVADSQNGFSGGSGNTWEYRWVSFPNVFDHSVDVWVQKWVKMPNSGKPEANGERPRLQINSKSSDKFKKYECIHPNCGKTFFDHSSLKKHLLVHGERMVHFHSNFPF